MVLKKTGRMNGVTIIPGHANHVPVPILNR